MTEQSRERLERIWREVAAIPPGRVATYGGIARRAGLGRRARLVGHALKVAPDGLDLPWHRVVNARGAVSFPEGSRQHREQCRRLRQEGIVVRAGRVDLARHGGERDLDALLWGPGA